MALATLLTLVFTTGLAAQSTKPKAEAASRPSGVQPVKKEEPFAGPKLDDKTFTHYGEGAHAGKALTVAEVLKDPSAYDGKQIRVSGNIGSVCQKKGCWMRVGAPESDIFVRFKDYGFFMPLDSAGREIVFEGVFKVSEISVEQQRHYLEDAKKPEEAKKITEPKKEFTFLAQGVAMKGAAPVKTNESSGDKKSSGDKRSSGDKN